MSRILYPYWMQTKLPCGDCAKCCETNAGNVAAGEREYEIIRDYIQEKDIQWKPLGKTACGFLGKDKRCRIYEVRPFPCRAFGQTVEAPCELLPDVKLRPYPLEESQPEFGNVGVPLWTLREVGVHA